MIVDLESARDWASLLGLADTPLFANDDNVAAGNHLVLLDGGSGSFALSVLPQQDAIESAVENWIWSADVAHHVGVLRDKVRVTRWDDPAAERIFTRRSLEQKLDVFYRYIVTDRITEGRSIVDHVIDLFRKLRNIVVHQTQRDDASIHAFLAVLAALSSDRGLEGLSDLDWLFDKFELDPQFIEVLRRIDRKSIVGTVDHYRLCRTGSRLLEMLPRLAIRHAGGLVFQEAHFELLRTKSEDIFGYSAPAEVKISTRGGTHFTPPPLARSVVEQALRQLAPLSDRPSIVVLDPACGSGAFLHEVLRALRRADYRGEVELLGKDISAQAVAMARFVLRRASQDWAEGRIKQIDITVGNSLDPDIVALPAADLVVMNPPFISWAGLSSEQRDEVRDALGTLYVGQPDFSMAFVLRALRSVRESGAIGTLIPASLLVAQTAKKWRHALLDLASLNFLAVIGDYGLFPHALVQVAALVMSKNEPANSKPEYLSLWTNETRGVAGEAMRALRRCSNTVHSGPLTGKGWRVGQDSALQLRAEVDWRPKPKILEPILPAIKDTAGNSVKDLFEVAEGIRTGMREAFFLSADRHEAFSEAEKRYFRPVAENRNISDGRIYSGDYLFYPYSKGLPPIDDENALQKAVPRFYEENLLPNKDSLGKRVAITRRLGKQSTRWWDLNWHRPWLVEPRSKIVTAYFGQSGSFSCDLVGNLVIVQGHGWLPSTKLKRSHKSLDERVTEKMSPFFLAAYVSLLNSEIFTSLLTEYCPHVAGGQFNLSKRFVDTIPLPNLPAIAADSARGNMVFELEKQGTALITGNATSPARINQISALLYGIPVEQWPDT